MAEIKLLVEIKYNIPDKQYKREDVERLETYFDNIFYGAGWPPNIQELNVLEETVFYEDWKKEVS